MTDELIDRIYECAVVPELWPAVLDDLAGVIEARGGLVFSARKAVCWTASGSVEDLFEEYFSDGWFDRCSRRVCSIGAEKPSFFVEHDFWTEAQLNDDPMYRDLFRPHGVGWSAWTGLRMPTGDEIVVSIERPFERGPIERELVERLNVLRPHLVRSALVSGRLGLERAKGATEALMSLGLPALLLDGAGRVMEANPMIEALPDQVRLGAHNRVVLNDGRANETLTSLLSSIDRTASATARSFPIRDEAGQPVALAHLMPIRRSAHEILGLSYALLVLTPLAGGAGPAPDLLRSLFNLTPAEARVARELSRGRSPEQIADTSGVSITTVRSQVRKILEKTGCTRQAEAAALLARLSLARD